MCPTGYSTISAMRSVQPFICEISDKDLRSVTAALAMGSYSCGYALAMTLGAFIQEWRYIMAGFGSLLILLVVGLTTLIHDSPYWLLKKGREAEARKAWDFFNPPSADDNDHLVVEYGKLVKAAQKDIQQRKSIAKEG